MQKFYQGNLKTDREESLKKPKGHEWLIGDFEKFNKTIRKTKLLELKYWEIKKGEEEKHKAKVQKSVGEITILLEGTTKGFIGEKDVTLKDGDYVYIPPGVANNLVVEIIPERIKGLTIKAPSDETDFIKILRVK